MRDASADLPVRAPPESATTRVGILAGGGRLPLQIAESVTGRGGTVHIVGIEGEADADIARFPHTWINWGQIGRMVATLHGEGARELVIAGAVRRPNLRRIRPDAGFFRNIPLIMRLLAGGDDSVLTRVVRFFEGNGFTVRGVHEVAPDLLAGTGALGAVALSEPDRDDAMLGSAVREALGAVDTGQAVAVAGGRILAIEGAEGTDALLARVARLPGRSELAGPRGVLAKGPKPRQEMRIDMPTIGPRTIAGAAAAGLAGVAIENAAVLVLDREETIREGDRRQCAVVGLAAGARSQGARASSGSRPRTGRVIGRLRPTRRDTGDIETGLAAVESLAAFATGSAAVVVRRYVLAIETVEGTHAMLQRAAALRGQWGLRWRSVGTLIMRADGAPPDNKALAAVLAEAAAQELAGVAITGTTTALADFEDAGPVADALGLFLVLCES